MRSNLPPSSPVVLPTWEGVDQMHVTRLIAITMAAGMAVAPVAATAQVTQPSQIPSSGVLKPPADVDPGIQAKPPVAASKLPTTVIPPPGTPGGNPSTKAK